MPNKRQFPFLMGCDPEFLLKFAGKVLTPYTASNVLKGGYGVNLNSVGSLGSDGSLCELRPGPSKNIHEIARNIKAILGTAAKSPLGAFEWTPLSTEHGNACGGHIHIGIPDDLVNRSGYSERITPRGYQVARQMFSFYLPLWLADTQTNTALRSKTGYGKYGDFRLDPHAYTDKSGQQHTSYTFELRTPTAEWLTSPKTMLATFAYVGVVMNEILNHPDHMKEYEEFIFKRTEEYPTLERLAQERNTIFIGPLLKKIKRAVKKFELYQDYKKEINFLLDEEKMHAEKARCEYSILKGWKLEGKAPDLDSMVNKRSFAQKIAEINERGYDSNPGSLNPHVINGEIGVNNLVHGLNKTAIAYHWKLKHQYVFFGIKDKTAGGTIVADKNYNIISGVEFIQTEEQQKRVKRALRRMLEKYVPNQNTYLVGLPKDIRKEGNVQKLVEFVHMLERTLPPEGEPLPREAIQLNVANVTAMQKEQETPQYEPATSELAF